MEYKFSNYNILTKHNGKNMVFNSRTLSVAELEDYEYELFSDNLINKNIE